MGCSSAQAARADGGPACYCRRWCCLPAQPLTVTYAFRVYKLNPRSEHDLSAGSKVWIEPIGRSYRSSRCRQCLARDETGSPPQPGMSKARQVRISRYVRLEAKDAAQQRGAQGGGPPQGANGGSGPRVSPIRCAQHGNHSLPPPKTQLDEFKANRRSSKAVSIRADEVIRDQDLARLDRGVPLPVGAPAWGQRGALWGGERRAGHWACGGRCVGIRSGRRSGQGGAPVPPGYALPHPAAAPHSARCLPRPGLHGARRPPRPASPPLPPAGHHPRGRGHHGSWGLTHAVKDPSYI